MIEALRGLKFANVWEMSKGFLCPSHVPPPFPCVAHIGFSWELLNTCKSGGTLVFYWPIMPAALKHRSFPSLISTLSLSSVDVWIVGRNSHSVAWLFPWFLFAFKQGSPLRVVPWLSRVWYLCRLPWDSIAAWPAFHHPKRGKTPPPKNSFSKDNILSSEYTLKSRLSFLLESLDSFQMP